MKKRFFLCIAVLLAAVPLFGQVSFPDYSGVPPWHRSGWAPNIIWMDDVRAVPVGGFVSFPVFLSANPQDHLRTVTISTRFDSSQIRILSGGAPPSFWGRAPLLESIYFQGDSGYSGTYMLSGSLPENYSEGTCTRIVKIKVNKNLSDTVVIKSSEGDSVGIRMPVTQVEMPVSAIFDNRVYPSKIWNPIFNVIKVPLWGDVVGHGRVTDTCALQILKAVTRQIPESDTFAVTANVDGSASPFLLTSRDALLVFRRSQGDMTFFPVESGYESVDTQSVSMRDTVVSGSKEIRLSGGSSVTNADFMIQLPSAAYVEKGPALQNAYCEIQEVPCEWWEPENCKNVYVSFFQSTRIVSVSDPLLVVRGAGAESAVVYAIANANVPVEIPRPSGSSGNQPNFMPSGNLISDNYPNPFNPVTTIRYMLPEQATVRLKVYSMLGEEVAVLVDGETKEKGLYEVQFNAASLSSGMYLYKLDTGKEALFRRILLMK